MSVTEMDFLDANLKSIRQESDQLESVGKSGWQSLYVTSWTSQNTRVACGQMSFSRYGATSSIIKSAKLEKINLSVYKITCRGSERNLDSCDIQSASSNSVCSLIQLKCLPGTVLARIRDRGWLCCTFSFN